MSSPELHDGEESLGCLNDQDKPDIPIVGILPAASTSYSLPQNCLGIVLVDTSSRNLQLAVGSDLNNVSYSDSSLTGLQGRQLVPSTIAIPGIFQQVPTSDIDDGEYVDGHVEDVCDDSLDGTHVVQQGVLTNASHQQGTQKIEKKKGGWPKGKKRKDVPEIVAPKAPPTGYVTFARIRRQEIKLSHPEIPFYEVTKLLGQEWTELDSEKKQKYLDDADEAKKKYYDEMKAFKDSDAYKNVMMKKKRKISENGLSDQEAQGNIKACIEDEINNLYCEICDQCFTSSHNKKEHMFGKQHLQNISGEIHKQEKEVLKQKDEHLHTSTEESDSEQTLSDRPVDIQGFINSFRAQNHEREQEMSKLKLHVKSAQEENASLYKQFEELKMYHHRLMEEIEANKQYCHNIINQTETLRMITSMFGALFGVINFEV